MNIGAHYKATVLIANLLLIVAILAVWSTPCYAEELICFDLQDGQKLISVHERLEYTEQAHEYCMKQNNALNEIVINMHEIEDDYEGQLKACDMALTALDKSSNAEREICSASIEAATPTIWYKIRMTVTGMAMGLLIGALMI
jgi:hypothetical protein